MVEEPRGGARQRGRSKYKQAKALELSQRGHAAAQLYLSGMSIAAIAQRTGLSYKMVSDDLKRLKQRYDDQSLTLRDEYVKRELAKLDTLELDVVEKIVAMREWFNALRERLEEGDIVAAMELMGDDLTLDLKLKFGAHDTMLRIMKRRADLLGLDAPVRLELSGRDGKPLEVQIPELPEAELDRLIAEELKKKKKDKRRRTNGADPNG